MYTGKTHLLSAVVKSEGLRVKNPFVWIVTHRMELVSNTEETIDRKSQSDSSLLILRSKSTDMKTTITFILAAMSLCASAQTFDFSADIHTHEYDGLTIYLIKNDVVWRDRAIRIDSCKIVGGKYHFSLPAPDSAFVATVALPPKNKNFMYGLPEIQCIVEDGKVNADCRGFALTLKGGKLNQSYDDDFLTHNRMLRQKVDSMMSRRDSIEKHRQLTDAEDGAYTTQIKAMYDGLKPFLCRFMRARE